MVVPFQLPMILFLPTEPVADKNVGMFAYDNGFEKHVICKCDVLL